MKNYDIVIIGGGPAGLAAMFVIGLDGDYYNVMGLPVCPLAMILRKFGVKLLGC